MRTRLSAATTLVFGLLGSAVIYLLWAMFGQQASGTPTCTIYWTGATSTSWNTSTNWSLTNGGGSAGRTPSSTDFVCMSTNPIRQAVVAPSATSRTIAGIAWPKTATVTPSLDLQGGTFTVNTNASTIYNVTDEGGTLTGSAPLSLDGTTTVASSTLLITGTGQKSIASTGTLNVGPSITLDIGSTSSPQAFVNLGTANFAAGAVLALSASNSVASTFANAATLSLADSTYVYPYTSGSKSPALLNSGTLTTASATTSQPQLQTLFTNTGTVVVGASGLYLSGSNATSTTDTGTWNTAAGQLIVAADRTMSSGSITGSAGVVASGGSLTFGSGVSVSTLTLAGGTVSGSPSIGTLTATAGGTFTGSGTATITGSGSQLCNLNLAAGYRLLNQGTTGYDTGCGYVSLAGGSTLENAGTLAVTGTGNYYLYDDGNAANAVLNDTGATLSVALADPSDTATISAPFTNKGTVPVTEGSLDLDDGNAASTTDTGTIALSTGSTLIFDGGSRSVPAGGVTGAGAVLVRGGTVTFASGVSISNLTLAGGTVSGSPTIGTLTATAGGTFTGSGTATVTGSGSQLCNLNLAAGYRLLNQGTTGYDTGCGYVSLAGGSTVENAGTLAVTGTGNYYLYDDGNAANAVLNDTGATLSVALADPSDTATISAPFTNKGTVSVTEGSLDLDDGNAASTTDTGTIALSTGSTLIFDGGSRSVPAGGVTGAGAVLVRGGTVTFASGVSISNLTLAGGTVSGSPTIGTLTATAGGTFTGSGTATITGSGSQLCNLNLAAGYRLLNQGTTGYDTGCGYVSLAGGSTVENAGTLAVTGTGNSYLYDDGNPANAVLNDTGATLSVALAAGNDTANLATTLTNLGTINVAVGTLSLSQVTNLSGGTLTGGSWLAGGGTISLPGEVTANAATVTVNANSSIIDASTGSDALRDLASNTGTLTLGKSETSTATVANSGTVVLSGGTFNPAAYSQSAGITTVGAAATLRSGGGTAAVTISGGTLTGSGAVRGAVTDAATVSPGVSGIGTLTVTGTYSQSGAGTLAVTAAAAGSGSALAVSGAVNLAGTLAITTPASAPPIGTVATVVTGSTRTGTFATVVGLDVPAANGYWKVAYTTTGVTLTLTAYPTVSVASASVAEGNSGTSALTFTVTLSAASSQPITVNYATSDGTATAPSDYTATAGTLTFAPGVTSQSVTVSVNGDTRYEHNETLALTLTAPSHATVVGGPATGTITNDDTAPTVSVGNANATVTASSAATVSFPVTLSAVSGVDVTVSYATADGTAHAGTDYVATSGTLTIAAGSTTGTISVPALAAAGTGSKTFTVVLSGPVDATIGTATGTGTITANNAAGGGTVTSITPSSVAQGTTSTVTIAGTGFVAGSTVTPPAGITVSAVKVVSSVKITAKMAVSPTATPGPRDVTVTGPGVNATCTGCLHVTQPPVVTSAAPNTLQTGATKVTVRVTGDHFASGAAVTFTKSGSPTIKGTSVVVGSATSLTTAVTVPATAAIGTYNVVVTNPDKSAGSCAGCFTVTQGPQVTGISPSSVARGSTVSVTLTGSNFATGIKLAGTNLTFTTVTVVNSTTITATMAVASSSPTGAKAITVTNPLAAGAGSVVFTGLTIT